MGDAPKARVTVPMNKHVTGLHAGHKALLKTAKDIGDHTAVPILPVHSATWYNYILTGNIPPVDSTDISQQLADIVNEDGFPSVMPPVVIAEADRLRWLDKADSVMPLFQQYIHTPSHRVLARGMMADLCRQIERSVGRVKYTVRGPEFHQFLTKAVKPLLGSSVEVIIANKVYKDEKYKVKLQSGLDKIAPQYQHEIERISDMLIGVKPHLKIGSNSELIKELNDAYQHVHWTVHGISVIEGGIVPGRLETIQFLFPSIDGGLVLIEDIDYEEM